MESKTKECEIVEDLLLGYIDETLNEESKKLVEKHLSRCENCKYKLSEIQKDINETEISQKKQIDYLKKVRLKNKLKVIFLTIGIIAIFLLIIYISKFIIINNFVDKAQKLLQSNNIYREQTSILSDNKTSLTKQYYKDGKYKEVWEIYSDDGVETRSIVYANKNSNERITITENENKVIKEKGKVAEMMNKCFMTIPFISYENLITKLGKACMMSIDTSNFGNKECYVLKNQFEKSKEWEVWIDKETGLLVKEVRLNGTKEFFPGTDVVKTVRDNIDEYKYEFGVVTDEDVTVPDLSNYKIEEINIDVEDLKNN